MNKGIINQSLLEQNIKRIEFYSNEEKKLLNNICTVLEEGCGEYRSPNVNLLLNNINALKNKIQLINNKRNKYVDILNKVINKYNELANFTQKNFNGDN